LTVGRGQVAIAGCSDRGAAKESEMPVINKIAPCLWFDSQAEEAAKFYTSIFKGSKIVRVSHYTEVGREFHGRSPGSVMTVVFELAGQSFTALNGGPHFKFNEAISFEVHCDTQEEIDYFWTKLTDGGQESQCGWLKDRFGVSWQIIPAMLADLFTAAAPEKEGRAMQALLGMKKLDIAALSRAYAG
jgi:predicted 3-demethylubiquinone-9 3-methyltransferase (glyoxalase superfamily)